MIELKDIRFYVEEDGKEKRILDGVSMNIEDDRLTVITGPNGSGKSTLLKIIMGIEKPTGGRILLNGQDITDMSITDRARLGMSYAFQQPVRFKGITVLSLLRMAAGREISANDACEILSRVGLCAKGYIDREVNDSLSGGELKRIEIAASICRGTAVSLFDEPEAGIDLWSFQNLVKIFEDIKAKSHGTVVIISHQERILRIADRVVLIRNGKNAAEGSAEDILPQLERHADICTCFHRQ